MDNKIEYSIYNPIMEPIKPMGYSPPPPPHPRISDLGQLQEIVNYLTDRYHMPAIELKYESFDGGGLAGNIKQIVIKTRYWKIKGVDTWFLGHFLDEFYAIIHQLAEEYHNAKVPKINNLNIETILHQKKLNAKSSLTNKLDNLPLDNVLKPKVIDDVNKALDDEHKKEFEPPPRSIGSGPRILDI